MIMNSTAQSEIFAANEAVTASGYTDILITVLVYNTSPSRKLAELFDTRFMNPAKRPVWYTCTIRLAEIINYVTE